MHGAEAAQTATVRSVAHVDVTSISLFFALLAVLGGAAAVAVLAISFVASNAVVRLRHDVADAALPLALLVAATCTVGSLYYSEVMHYTPCKLCWFQRIFMYPLVVLLGIAVARKDRSVRRDVLPLSLIGGAISIYHYQLQRFPQQRTSMCTIDAPCTAKEVEQFGFVTIPMMALVGFALISALMFCLHGAARTAASATPIDEPETS